MPTIVSLAKSPERPIAGDVETETDSATSVGASRQRNVGCDVEIVDPE
jgi:hypothetical protein